MLKDKKLSIHLKEPISNLLIGVAMITFAFFPELFEDRIRVPLIEQTDMAIRQNGVSIGFAVFLLVLQGVEFVALKWKSAAVFSRNRNVFLSVKLGIGIFVLWLFHLAVSLLLGITADQALGINADGSRKWEGIVICAVIVKELFLLPFLLDLWGNEAAKLAAPAELARKETVADLLLFVFSAVAYITLWEYLAFDPQSSLVRYWTQPVMLWIEGFAAILLICMTLIPLKIPWLTEVWITRAFNRQTAVAGLSLLSLFLAALSPLFAGQHDLAKALAEPERTHRLFLQGFSGQSLPAEINTLQYLQVLFVENGTLQSLPPSIGELKDLRYLQIQSTSLSTVHRGIGGLEELGTLILRRNHLSSLPPEIGLLQNLRLLDISDNKLKRLPQGIEEMQALRELRLQGNPLSKDEVELLRMKMPRTKIVF